ncbi:MAG: 4Fe-4S binding protein [Planctomycetota bacterium]|jgi:ferredoxin-type protein NapG
MEPRYSRKALFRAGLSALLGSPETYAPPAPRWLRPPGAIEERAFLEACTRCDDCLVACPQFVIRKAGPEAGAMAGTPVIVPHENPCLMCQGLPCIERCGTGALVRGERTRIGLATVTAARCYMALGQPCDYCVVACPETPAAISVARGEAARVDVERCTGCGCCAQICPPGAIAILDQR